MFWAPKIQVTELATATKYYVKQIFSTAFPEGVLLYVLDTDYTNFAIRFMCFDSSHIFSFRELYNIYFN